MQIMVKHCEWLNMAKKASDLKKLYSTWYFMIIHSHRKYLKYKSLFTFCI